MKHIAIFIIKAFRRLSHIFTTITGQMYLLCLGVEIGRGLKLYGMPIVSMEPNSTISIGNHVVLCSKSTMTALGVQHPVILRTLNEGSEIRIENNVGISGATICASKKIHIGSETMLGTNVTIIDTDFHPLFAKNRRHNSDRTRILTKDVTIGKNVFVGMNVIIMKGVQIGDNSVIGAGSIVTSNIPENMIAAGNPCRVLRPLPAEHPLTVCTKDGSRHR